jgi:hypothetical protein
LATKNVKIKMYRTAILPVVLYGFVTWSVTLREERRPKVFENRVLWKTSGPKREWRRLHNEELHGPYSSPNIQVTKKNKMGGACSTYGGDGKCVRGFGVEA